MEEPRSRPMKNQPFAEVRWELIAGATLWTTSGENSETKNPGAAEKLETGPFPITTRLF
jgi:hypothetical protein